MSAILLLRRNRIFLKNVLNNKHVKRNERTSHYLFSTFSNDEYNGEPCLYTSDLKRQVLNLSKASSISERHEITVSIRDIINNAPEPDNEFEGIDGQLTGEEPIYLCLNSKIERLNTLHDTMIAYLHESSDEKDGDSAVKEDDEDMDELATVSPITPRTLTFGYTPFESIAALLNLLEDRYGLGSPSSPKLGSWLDLGSGDGNPTLSAALLRNWSSCIGIEVKQSLHQKSMRLKHLYETWQSTENKEDTYGFNKIISNEEANIETHIYTSSGQSKMMFFNTDMRSCFYKKQSENHSDEVGDLQDVSLMFIHSTCFDDATMLEVAALAQQLKPGTLIASVTKAIPSKYLQTLERRSLPFSWGVGTLHIQRRLEEVHVQNDTIPTQADGHHTINALNMQTQVQKGRSSNSGDKLILSYGGERVKNPATTELRHALSGHTVETLDTELNQLNRSSCLDLLADQINVGISNLTSLPNNDGKGPNHEDYLKCLDLTIEAACTISKATSEHELNARAIIDSGYMSTYKNFLEYGIYNMLTMTPEKILLKASSDNGTQVQFDNVMYGKLLGCWASSCLVTAALSSHYGCTDRMLSSRVIHALVDLVTNNKDVFNNTSSNIVNDVDVPFAIRGAAAAALCNAAINVNVAYELKSVLKFDVELKKLMESEDGKANESFCESANACIQSMERYAPLYMKHEK